MMETFPKAFLIENLFKPKENSVISEGLGLNEKTKLK